jgi:hypothetical protein
MSLLECPAPGLKHDAQSHFGRCRFVAEHNGAMGSLRHDIQYDT